jgi:hypothetical protein
MSKRMTNDRGFLYKMKAAGEKRAEAAKNVNISAA